MSVAPPLYSDVVFRLLEEVDLLLKHYVYNGYHALSSYLAIPLGLISTLYIIVIGYAVMSGWLTLSLGEFLKSIFKVAIIYTAVTQWTFVSEYLVWLVNGLISGVGEALTAASPVHIPGAGGIDGGMQVMLIQFSKIGDTVFQTGGITNMGPWIDGIIIWGFGYIIVGVSLFEIILSKIMLAILFIFAPLIVLACYFKPFQGVFDRWLGAIVGFALLQLFVTATSALALSICYWWSAGHAFETAVQIGNYGTLPIIIIGILCIGLIFQASSLAQNLGGSVSSVSSSAMAGAMVGGAVGGAFRHGSFGLRSTRVAASAAGRGLRQFSRLGG